MRVLTFFHSEIDVFVRMTGRERETVDRLAEAHDDFVWRNLSRTHATDCVDDRGGDLLAYLRCATRLREPRDVNKRHVSRET